MHPTKQIRLAVSSTNTFQPTADLDQSLILTAPVGLNNKIRDDSRPTVLSSTTLSHELETEPVDLAQNDLIRDIHSPPPYPFSHCYMNIDGMLELVGIFIRSS